MGRAVKESKSEVMIEWLQRRQDPVLHVCIRAEELTLDVVARELSRRACYGLVL